MVPESQPLSKTLESFISRLLQGVSRSPLLKAFPTKTVKRIDLERLRIITDDAPERLIAGLLSPSGRVRFQFERFATIGKDGEESRELFATLKTKLSRGAQLIFRETGLRTLWLAFPILYVPYPAGDPGEFLLAPLFLWPLQILSSGMKEGELVIARDPDGGPPRFNRVAMQWIRRYLDFDPAEPSAADVRDVGSIADVGALCRTLCESFQPPINVVMAGTIAPIPTRSNLSDQNKPALFNSGLLGLIQWENQELIRDLEVLSKMKTIDGAAADLLHGIEQKPLSCLSVPEEVDRYFVTDTDVSQERAVWMARTESGVVVHGPPGTGKSQVIVNIVADSLAHGQKVLIICQKKAALDVVASRLNAAGLGNLFLQVDDAEADRRRIIEALKSQERPLVGEVAAYRKETALAISRIEQELETYRKALFDIRFSHGISYREMLGKIAIIRHKVPGLSPSVSLQQVFKSMNHSEVIRLSNTFRDIERIFIEADPLKNPWRYAHHDMTYDPYERKNIARELEILLELSGRADKWAGVSGPKRLVLVGDCQRVSLSAAEIGKHLINLKPSLLSPGRYKGKVRQDKAISRPQHWNNVSTRYS